MKQVALLKNKNIHDQGSHEFENHRRISRKYSVDLIDFPNL